MYWAAKDISRSTYNPFRYEGNMVIVSPCSYCLSVWRAVTSCAAFYDTARCKATPFSRELSTYLRARKTRVWGQQRTRSWGHPSRSRKCCLCPRKETTRQCGHPTDQEYYSVLVRHVPSNKIINDTAQEQLRVWIILRVCCILNRQLYAKNLLRSYLDPEDGGDMLLRNIGSYTDCTAVYPRRWQLPLTTTVWTSNLTKLRLFCTYVGLPTCFESKPLITICSAPETLIVVRPVIVSDRWEYTGLRAERNNRSHLLQQRQNLESHRSKVKQKKKKVKLSP
jgi:hypothetical protein